MVASVIADPDAVLAAFVPPDDLGIGYAPMLAGGLPAGSSMPGSTDHPESAAVYTALPGAGEHAARHLQLVYSGAAQSGIRSLDLFVVSDDEAEAAITTAMKQPLDVAACQTAVLQTTLGSPTSTPPSPGSEGCRRSSRISVAGADDQGPVPRPQPDLQPALLPQRAVGRRGIAGPSDGRQRCGCPR